MCFFVGIERTRGAEGLNRAVRIARQEQRIAEVVMRFGQAGSQFHGAPGMRQGIAKAIERQIRGRHIHMGVRIERCAQDCLPENCNGSIGLTRCERVAP